MAADEPGRLVLLGAGGTARDVISIIEDINRAGGRLRVEAVLDDNPKLWKTEVLGVPVAGPLSEAEKLSGKLFVNTLGSPRNFAIRRTVGERLRKLGMRFASIVHPSAVISRFATVGEGTIAFPQVVVMANVKLGCDALLLSNTVLNHDVNFGDYSIAASGVNVSGSVRIGQGCYLGVSTSVMQDIAIGDGALVGMGSVVIRDVAEATVVAGNPARVLRRVG